LGRRDLYCVAILIALPTLIFSDVLFGGANFFHRDLAPYHFPMKRIVRDAMLGGEIPFWNRDFAGGQPLAANPAYELFYPGQWPILIGSYPFGFAFHILLHLHVAALGMFLLLRHFRLSPASATFGALSYGLGGILVGSMSVLPTFFVWALAPLVAWTIARFLAHPTPRRFAVAVLCAGVQLLVVEPISLLQVWVLYAAGAALLSVSLNLRLVRAATLLIAIGMGAFLVAAVQAIPSIDHVGDSARSRGLVFSIVADFSLAPLRVLEVFTPSVYHSALRGSPALWGRDVVLRNGARPYFDSIYPGVAVAILAIAGLLARVRGAGPTALIALVSLILALGDATPLLRTLYELGIARVLRYPEKFVFMGIAALIVFSAFVCERFLAGDQRVRRSVAIAAALVVTVRLVPVLWSITPGYVPSFLRYWRLQPQSASLALIARNAWMIALVIAGFLLAVLLLRSRLRPVVFLLALTLTVAVDVAIHANGIAPRVPSQFYSPPSVAEMILADDRDAAVFHRGHWNPDSVDQARYKALSASWLNRNAMEPLMAPAWGLRSVLELDYDETFLLPTHEMLDRMMALGNGGFERWWEPFAILNGAGYILDYRDFDQAMSEARGDAFLLRAANVFRLPAQPRYFVAQRTVQATDEREIVAFLSANPRPFLTAITSFAAPAVSHGNVTRYAEEQNSATIDVESSGPALLVMTVTRHKYWQAWIDGKHAELLPVNIAYQGVLVPAGKHRVTMRYRNPLVVWGGVITLFALLALATTLIRPRPRLRTGS
jgi:hypothetical protein